MNETQMLNAQASMKQVVRELSAVPQRYAVGIDPQAAPSDIVWHTFGTTKSVPSFVKRRPDDEYTFTADWDLLPDGTLKPLSWRAITASMEFEYQDREKFDRMVQTVYGTFPRAW